MARGVGPPELGPQPRGFGQNSFPAKALASAAKAPNEKKVVRRFRDCVEGCIPAKAHLQPHQSLKGITPLRGASTPGWIGCCSQCFVRILSRESCFSSQHEAPRWHDILLVVDLTKPKPFDTSRRGVRFTSLPCTKYINFTLVDPLG